jgi:hypothetical protein
MPPADRVIRGVGQCMRRPYFIKTTNWIWKGFWLHSTQLISSHLGEGRVEIAKNKPQCCRGRSTSLQSGEDNRCV